MKTAYCFDLDGTLTKTEVLPCIASEIGISDEIATLTQATMDGHIAFEPSFKLRCLILGGVPISNVHRIIKDIPLDQHILSFIRDRKESSFLVTGNLDVWISPIVETCGCGSYSSIADVDDGVVKLRSILNKSDAITDIRAMGYTRIVAVGDGANDVPMLNLADIPIAFGGVHTPAPSALAAADYVFHEGESLCKMLRAL